MKYARIIIVEIITTCLILLTLISTVTAATINAADYGDGTCSKANAEAAIAASSNGDIVTIPSGDCTWSANITLNKEITIQGNSVMSRNASTFVITPTDNTIIREHGFDITATTVRITGITFDDYEYNLGTGHILFTFPDPIVKIRIDHCNFISGVKMWNPKGHPQYSILFDTNLIQDPGYEVIYVLGRGNTDWSEGGTCGADNPEKAVWIENNEFRTVNIDGANPIDAGNGARVAIRNNLFTNGAGTVWSQFIIEAHGHCFTYRDSSENAGTYCMEVSGNKVYSATTANIGQGFFKPRGGRSITRSNVITTEGKGLGMSFHAEEALINCNGSGAGPCGVADHYNTGLALNYHTVPIADDSHYQAANTMCSSWPCTPMQNMNSYVFKNTIDGGDITVTATDGNFVQRNRDWWDDINGTFTEGTSRPATCTTHDLYWNTSTLMLSRCSDTDTWTDVYTSFGTSVPIDANGFPDFSGEEADTTAPTVTAFTIPATSSSTTITISSFTGTDAVGVTGYCVTSTNSSAGCTWSGSAPASTAVASDGAWTLYGWCKDAAGNVSSSASDSVLVTIATAAATLGGSAAMTISRDGGTAGGATIVR